MFDTLYEDYMIEEAIDFLVSEIKNSNGIISVGIDASGMPDFQEDNLIRSVVTQLYGINAPQMANYLKVQEAVLDKVLTRLFSYLNYTIGCNNFHTLRLVPFNIYHNILIDRIMNNPFSSPDLYYWNPNEKWNVEAKNINENMAISNSLNGYMEVWLVLKCNIKKNMISKLKVNDIPIVIGKDNLQIKLLPYNNFNKIINILDTIFAYI